MFRSRTLGVLVAVLVALTTLGALVFQGPGTEPGHRVVLDGTPTVPAEGLPAPDVTAEAVESGDLDRLMGVVRVTLLLAAGAAAVSLTGLMGGEALGRSRRWSVEVLMGAPLRTMLAQQAKRWRARLVSGWAAGLLAAGAGALAMGAVAPPGIGMGAIEPMNAVAWSLALVLGVLALALRPVRALYRSRGRVAASIRVGGASEPAGVRFRRVMLVTFQLAAAVALVVAAGLLRVGGSRGGGVEADDAVVATFVATGDSARDAGLRSALLGAAWSRLEAHPGLVAESLSTPGAWLDRGPETIAANECGRCSTGGMPHPVHVTLVRHHVVVPGFLVGRGVQVLDGRALARGDVSSADPVVVINESYARAHFQDGPAVGKKLALGGLGGDWHTVVGVVSDVPSTGLGRSGSPFAVYFSALQHPPSTVQLIARLPVPAQDPDVEATTRVLEEALAAEATGDLALRGVQAAHDEVERIHGPSAWLGLGTRGLGWSAAAVAALAIWATVAGLVRARGRELGTRSALGAGPRTLTWLIMGEAGRMGLVGVGLGLWGATAIVGILGPEGGPLFRAGLFFGVGGFFLLLTLLSAVPGAREAARIHPAVALSSLE